MSDTQVVAGPQENPVPETERPTPHRLRTPLMSSLRALVRPSLAAAKPTMRLAMVLWFAAIVGYWILVSGSGKVLPSFGEIVQAFGDLWANDGLGRELFTSFKLNLCAVGLATLLSLTVAYSSVFPLIRPGATFYTKLRFLSMAGLLIIFYLTFSRSTFQLKLALLTFGISVFFVKSMLGVVTQIPKERFDYARTLRLGEGRVIYEVVVRGTAVQAFDVLQDCSAMGWMLLTMVEGIARSGGGIGILLLNQDKHFHLAEVFAIQFGILALGLGWDYAIGVAKNLVCPYAALKLERR